MPAHTTTRIESAELTDIEPAAYRADAVVLLGGDKDDSKPVLGIVVEVQLTRAERKRFTRPSYVMHLRARFECAECVLVFTADERIARWCSEPIATGPGSVFIPLVVAPATMPVIDDETTVRLSPELAVLSCIAHGDDRDSDAVALSTCKILDAAQHVLPDDRKLLYHDLILTSLSAAARAALEKLMTSGNYEFQSDFARTYLAKGRQEGRQEGELEGQAKALLAMLESRGLGISAEAHDRIRACTDGAQLDAWIRKAASVASVDDLFQPGEASGRRQ